MNLQKILIILLFFCNKSYNQNLIPNFSFENITESIGDFVDSYEKFDSCVVDWQSANLSTSDIISLSNSDRVSNEMSVNAPIFGNNCVGMIMSKGLARRKIGAINDDDIWAESIQAKLNAPLEKDSTYLFTCWLSSNAPFKVFSGFGFKLTDSLIFSNDKSHSNFSQYFQIATTPVSKRWKKYSLVFTAKESSSHITIGYINPSEYPKMCSHYTAIDQISLNKIAGSEFNFSLESIKNMEIQEGKLLPSLSIFFANKSYEISSEFYSTLDSLADFLKSESLLDIEIRGVANFKGNESDNLMLSELRAKSVFEYLIRKGVSSDQLSFVGLGEEKDAKNINVLRNSRRVDFFVNKYANKQEIYDLIHKYGKLERSDSVFFYIKELLKRGDLEIEVLVDPALQFFFSTKNGSITKNILYNDFKAKHLNIKNPKLAFELKLKLLEDQLIMTANRFSFFSLRQLDTLEVDSLIKSYDKTNKTHIDFLSKINKNHTFLPPRYEIGFGGMDAIFAIVQHSENLELLKKYIKLFENASKNDEYIQRYAAFFIDRLMVLENKEQIYGTQFYYSGKEKMLYPIIKKEQVNQRRMEKGLYPLTSDELNMMLK